MVVFQTACVGKRVRGNISRLIKVIESKQTEEEIAEGHGKNVDAMSRSWLLSCEEEDQEEDKRNGAVVLDLLYRMVTPVLIRDAM